MRRNNIPQRQMAVRHRRSGHIGCGRNTIWNHCVFCAGQGLYAVYDDCSLTRAVNTRAAPVEKIGKIADFRLPRRIDKHRAPLCRGGGQHDVFRSAYAWKG